MTLYGPGGVDAKQPRQGLFTRLHPAVTAGVSAAVIAVLALTFWIWRATTGSPQPAAAAASASPSPSPVPSSAAPVRLATGSWLISPLDDPDTYLTTKAGFAALTAEQLEVNVVKGLADDACFSLRTDDGRYLRHFDYRLRFDATEDGELFRNDATFCPVEGQRAGTVRLSSKNYPDHVIHRRGTELYIDKPDDSAKFTKESTFSIERAE